MARESQQVIDAIGEPIEAGMLISGSFNVSGPSGEADFSMPISGPDGKATLYVEAAKSAGKWEYHVLEAEIRETGERIDLLKAD